MFRSFWVFFGSVWLVVGLPFLLLSIYFITQGTDRKLSELLLFGAVGLVHVHCWSHDCAGGVE